MKQQTLQDFCSLHLCVSALSFHQSVLLAGDGGVLEVDLDVVDLVDVQHGKPAVGLTLFPSKE